MNGDSDTLMLPDPNNNPRADEIEEEEEGEEEEVAASSCEKPEPLGVAEAFSLLPLLPLLPHTSKRNARPTSSDVGVY